MAGTPDRTLTQALNSYLSGETIRIALISTATAYTFDPSAHEHVSDIFDGGTTAQEFSGTSGYTGTADRKTLANVSITEDNVDNEGVFDADDVSWSGVDGASDIQGWIVYLERGGDATTPADDPVLQVVDDDMASAPASLPISAGGGPVTIEWNAEGIINLLAT